MMSNEPATKEIRLAPDDIAEGLPCLLCNGPLRTMGRLGWREWLRCRNCGMDYGREIPRPAIKDNDDE